MILPCVAACVQSGGAPGFFPCLVECSQEQYDEGDHYEAAKDAAREAGYEMPLLVYDLNDGPAWLFRQFDWESAKTVKAKGSKKG